METVLRIERDSVSYTVTVPQAYKAKSQQHWVRKFSVPATYGLQGAMLVAEHLMQGDHGSIKSYSDCEVCICEAIAEEQRIGL